MWAGELTPSNSPTYCQELFSSKLHDVLRIGNAWFLAQNFLRLWPSTLAFHNEYSNGENVTTCLWNARQSTACRTGVSDTRIGHFALAFDENSIFTANDEFVMGFFSRVLDEKFQINFPFWKTFACTLVGHSAFRGERAKIVSDN